MPPALGREKSLERSPSAGKGLVGIRHVYAGDWVATRL
jgi:hypothetical protein